jgi:predicted alpha-1,6-mannanase (GH76 family)
MRNSQGLWNDGLTLGTCANNGQTTWTYNQAVVASGLAALSVATGNTTYLTEAEITLDAALADLTVNGILKESCDNVDSGTTPCNNDQTSFKV